MIFRRLSFWLALFGVLLTIATLWGASDRPLPPEPMEPPPANPYQQTVGAAGIIEAVHENVRIAPPISGLVTKVHVRVADTVKKGEPLFQLDDRELLAMLQTRIDSLPPAVARIAEQEIRLRDAQDQLRRLRSVEDRRAVSEDDVQKKWHEVEGAKRSLLRARADLKLARTERDEVRALVENDHRVVARLENPPRGGNVHRRVVGDGDGECAAEESHHDERVRDAHLVQLSRSEHG